MAINSQPNHQYVDLTSTAHTVCNLLTTLNLTTNQLLYRHDKASLKNYVEQTDATINSAVSAIQHLTILDKIQNGKIKPRFVQADVTKLIYQTMINKKLKWGAVNLNLHGLSNSRATDSFLLDTVIGELLDNSCRYKSSKVDISVDKAGDRTKIILLDDGEGIEPDELARVFEPYYRIKKHVARNRRAGLGLTTVEVITNQLEGTIKLDSHPDWGTKVELEF